MIVELIVERFNYAIVIVLMMLGLYILFSTGNLVKKLVGLTVFQTSVFLLYISIGKVAGGQPPILEAHHGGGHGESHYEETVTPHGEADSKPVDHSAADHESGETANQAAASPDEAVEAAPDPAAASDELATVEGALVENAPIEEGAGESAEEHEADGAAGPADATLADAADAALEPEAPATAARENDAVPRESAGPRYSNPLPHVLILTAIVVGVATLSVGLALVVRIREVYGTIEDDAISRADYERMAGAS